MPAPTWLAATSGQPGQAGQVNQLLTTHAVSFVYQGAEQSSQAAPGSGLDPGSNGQYVAQAFTTGSAQTTTGYVIVTAVAAGSPPPWGFSLQATGSGGPSGTPLVSATVPAEAVAAASAGLVTVLLPVTGLTPSTQYWIVAAPAGDADDYFAWSKSSQATGAMTSPDGVTWTAASYGLLYQVWDGTQVGELIGIYEDGGARSTVLGYSSGLVTKVGEYTSGQTVTGYAESSRTLSYSGSLMTGAA